MSKAEKRNFKLYATRLSGNQDAKFLTLFDVFDALDEYDEAKVLKKCPVVKKEQLPNMKAHLYKQLLVSMRLLNVQHNVGMQIREQMDFARILYDKGQYKQSQKYLDRAKELALTHKEYVMALQIAETQKAIDSLYVTRSMVNKSTAMSKAASELVKVVFRVNELSNLSNMLYSLHLKLGYVRSEKDIEVIDRYFKPLLERFGEKERNGELSFTELIYYYQSVVWYNYIRHNFVLSYRYAQRWLDAYGSSPHMRKAMYDNFIKGISRLLEALFLMNNHRRYKATMERFLEAGECLCGLNVNAEIIYSEVFFIARINLHFLEGTFTEGLGLVPEIERYLKKYPHNIDLHHRMLLYYKIACLYFGDGNHKKAMKYLQKVISIRDPLVRRDLQCYSRILYLIASYEAGLDYNLDYQLKAVYAFLVKMNDMHQVQCEMIDFIKRLHSIYNTDFKGELKSLYERLLPYTTHPYERRTFFYLDIISWLESKIRDVSVAEVRREKFLAAQKNRRGLRALRNTALDFGA
ncbi:MAG: hypothetical protein LUD68_04895 [Rikenellaceae bacterium]|nr:hypothetical protein [Rikenellaceae bacterium]